MRLSWLRWGNKYQRAPVARIGANIHPNGWCADIGRGLEDVVHADLRKDLPTKRAIDGKPGSQLRRCDADDTQSAIDQQLANIPAQTSRQRREAEVGEAASAGGGGEQAEACQAWSSASVSWPWLTDRALALAVAAELGVIILSVRS